MRRTTATGPSLEKAPNISTWKSEPKLGRETIEPESSGMVCPQPVGFTISPVSSFMADTWKIAWKIIARTVEDRRPMRMAPLTLRM